MSDTIPRDTVTATAVRFDVIRVMRVKGVPDEELAPMVVAHVEASVDGTPTAVLANVDLGDDDDRYRAGGNAWKLTEELVDLVQGTEFSFVDAESADGELMKLVEPLVEEQRRTKDEATTRKTRRRGKEIERAARHVLQGGVNVLKGRPFDTEPDRRGDRIAGIAALRIAAQGILSGNPSGTLTAASFTGSWADTSLEEFYETYLERLGAYVVAPTPAPPEHAGEPANEFPDAAAIEPLPKDGTKGHLLEREALRYGLVSTRFPNGTFVVSDHEGRRVNFKWGRSPIASGVSLSICSYKEATRRLLERVDVPVPAGRVFSVHDVDKALDFADRIGYPVVAKPVAGLRGIGVVADIRSRESLVDALELYRKSELGDDDFVIERHVPGEDYRIVVIDGEVVASVVRAPASVVGDGLHTIADLIEYKNRARKLNPHLSSRLITYSDALLYQLAQADLSPASIPESGVLVPLANSANLSQGGDSFEVVDQLHPSIKEVASRAVEAVPGLGFCGLDMLIEDPAKPMSEQQATVIELNAHAAIGSAQYPMWGTPTEVARLFFEATARDYGIPLPPERADELSLGLEIKGRVTGVGYRRWLRSRARRLGVRGVVKNTGRKSVSVQVTGDADAVSALVYLACKGPKRSIPSSVTTTHIDPFEADDFVDDRTNESPLTRAKGIVQRLRS
ncbi:acylphosphatase [Brevibacterium jeotgali]|uniref:acylphosphatase n=1 Tax=Brevibacterium jeotgali TaxID=1262550 RepID=A0A2H1L9P8_9MICO|nr:acylphosphatase [Brevibacterium jeotgali]TWB98835.1 D-alanine-D-alanine ligase-like ATP-grasp enzyme [Brevibacterium jeotgali]SMY13193.1 D-alanine-D-alanine ligase [Brevibacterium jeotgali]